MPAEAPTPKRQGNMEFLRIVADVLPEDTVHDSERAYDYLEELIRHKRQAEQNMPGGSFYEQLFLALKHNQNLSKILLEFGFEASDEDVTQFLQALARWLTASAAAPASQTGAESSPQASPTEVSDSLNSYLWPASFLNSWSGALREGQPADLTWMIEDGTTIICQNRRLQLDGHEAHAVNLLLLLRDYGPVSCVELQKLGFMPKARYAKEVGAVLARLAVKINTLAGRKVLTRIRLNTRWSYRLESAIILQELQRENLANRAHTLRLFGQHVLHVTQLIRHMALQRSVEPASRVRPQKKKEALDIEADIEALQDLPESARDRNWQQKAQCRDNPQLHWPEKKAIPEAKAVCARCPVRIECLDFALANKAAEGVWGGHGERDRNKIKNRLPVRYN